MLIVTDAFPPVCGGSGWSTYELARGLRARGHAVSVVGVQTTDGPARAYDGFEVLEFPVRAPKVPYLRNYIKNERLYRRLAHFLGGVIQRAGTRIVHAQHVLTGPPAIAAARANGVPVVCTVRDYWPVCYWSDLIYDFDAEGLCPACSTRMMTRCVRPRAGGAWPLALPMIPYMRSNLARKRRALAAADAVLAVSHRLASDLRARAPELGRTRVEVVPNAVDTAGIRAVVDQAPPPLDIPYAVYVGKLARNKGARKLAIALARAKLNWPLVIVGDGPDREALEAELGRLPGDVRFTGWLDHPSTLRWLGHASVLVFPSHGPESLSRVLLEGAVLARPIAAMDTGGTRDILTHDVSALLSSTAAELGHDLGRLAGDGELRARLGAAAALAAARFEATTVVARTEAVYDDLLRRRAAGRQMT